MRLYYFKAFLELRLTFSPAPIHFNECEACLLFCAILQVRLTFTIFSHFYECFHRHQFFPFA